MHSVLEKRVVTPSCINIRGAHTEKLTLNTQFDNTSRSGTKHSRFLYQSPRDKVCILSAAMRPLLLSDLFINHEIVYCVHYVSSTSFKSANKFLYATF